MNLAKVFDMQERRRGHERWKASLRQGKVPPSFGCSSTGCGAVPGLCFGCGRVTHVLPVTLGFSFWVPWGIG